MADHCNECGKEISLLNPFAEGSSDPRNNGKFICSSCYTLIKDRLDKEKKISELAGEEVHIERSSEKRVRVHDSKGEHCKECGADIGGMFGITKPETFLHPINNDLICKKCYYRIKEEVDKEKKLINDLEKRKQEEKKRIKEQENFPKEQKREKVSSSSTQEEVLIKLVLIIAAILGAIWLIIWVLKILAIISIAIISGLNSPGIMMIGIVALVINIFYQITLHPVIVWCMSIGITSGLVYLLYKKNLLMYYWIISGVLTGTLLFLFFSSYNRIPIIFSIPQAVSWVLNINFLSEHLPGSSFKYNYNYDSNNNFSTTTTEKTYQYGTIIEPQGIRFRSGPGISYKKMGILKYGKSFKVLSTDGPRETHNGVTGNWYKIQSEGQEGWVFGGFVKLEE